jgi:mono/diheme cytochrome c family protein
LNALFSWVRKPPKRSVSFFLTALLFATTLVTPAVSEKISDGDALFQQYCATCHGLKGVGEDLANLRGGWRKDGSRIAPALNGTAHSWHHEPELLYDYIKSGSVAPDSPMPSYGDELDDTQIKAIIEYFQTLWPEKIRGIYEKRFPGTFQ